MKNYRLKTFFTLLLAIALGAISFGANQAVGITPTYEPLGGYVSPTLKNLTILEKLGIGTSAPQADLHVTSSETNSSIAIEGADDPNSVSILRFLNVSGQQGSLSFYNNSNVLNLHSSNILRFLTGTDPLSEKLRITSDGKVGIGTTNPQVNLHVGGETKVDGRVSTSALKLSPFVGTRLSCTVDRSGTLLHEFSLTEGSKLLACVCTSTSSTGVCDQTEWTQLYPSSCSLEECTEFCEDCADGCEEGECEPPFAMESAQAFSRLDNGEIELRFNKDLQAIDNTRTRVKIGAFSWTRNLKDIFYIRNLRTGELLNIKEAYFKPLNSGSFDPSTVVFITDFKTNDHYLIEASNSILSVAENRLENNLFKFLGVNPVVTNINNCIEFFALNSSQGSSRYYRLTNDINCSSMQTWTPFHPFNGSLDGNGNNIIMPTLNRPNDNDVGLFREIGPNGKIFNLTLQKVDTIGLTNVGALAGKNFGQIYNVTIDLSIPTFGSNPDLGYIGGRIRGTSKVGGLVGLNYGLIENIKISDLRGLGALLRIEIPSSGNLEKMGGLVGENRGVIKGANLFDYWSPESKYRLTIIYDGDGRDVSCLGWLVGENEEGTISNTLHLKNQDKIIHNQVDSVGCYPHN
jgi:hypothetical protein